jgi:hypothetical protein
MGVLQNVGIFGYSIVKTDECKFSNTFDILQYYT